MFKVLEVLRFEVPESIEELGTCLDADAEFSHNNLPRIRNLWVLLLLHHIGSIDLLLNLRFELGSSVKMVVFNSSDEYCSIFKDFAVDLG